MSDELILTAFLMCWCRECNLLRRVYMSRDELLCKECGEMVAVLRDPIKRRPFPSRREMEQPL